MANITTIVNEPRRGCGFRREKGTYLVSEGPFAACGKLPIPLERCRVCGGGIKPARGFTWIEPQKLFGWEETNCGRPQCGSCPVAHPPEKAGLLFIGESFYPTPVDWTKEAIQQGVSRRIAQIPRGLVVGETVIFVAHRKACVTVEADGEHYTPGIFHAFRPQRMEYVLKGDEDEEELEKLEKRGLTLVRLVRDDRPRLAAEPELAQAESA